MKYKTGVDYDYWKTIFIVNSGLCFTTVFGAIKSLLDKGLYSHSTLIFFALELVFFFFTIKSFKKFLFFNNHLRNHIPD